jgi:hypothetical protein
MFPTRADIPDDAIEWAASPECRRRVKEKKRIGAESRNTHFSFTLVPTA